MGHGGLGNGDLDEKFGLDRMLGKMLQCGFVIGAV